MPKAPRPSRVVANDKVLSREVDDELVLYHPATDAVTHLDAIAAHVWRALQQPIFVTDLVDELTRRFKADRAIISADVRTLLGELMDAGLLQPI